MRIYLKNNPAKFHPDPIWSDVRFFEEAEEQEEKNN